MVNDTAITFVGDLTTDPELKLVPNGACVANFTVASIPRTFDEQSGERKDGGALFMRCNARRAVAENIAESLTKGTRVVAQGRLRQRSCTIDGDQRTIIDVEVDEIGPSLRYARAA